LIVVIDELDRSIEQSAVAVHVVAPDFERSENCLPAAATDPVNAMLKPTLTGSAALQGSYGVGHDAYGGLRHFALRCVKYLTHWHGQPR